MIDDLIEDLSEEGELDSVGQFTLDWEQAKEKLSKHRFTGLDTGLLALLKAIFLLQPESVRIVLPPGPIHLYLKGVELSRTQGEQLPNLAANLSGTSLFERGLSELALTMWSLSRGVCSGVQLMSSDWMGSFDGKGNWSSLTPFQSSPEPETVVGLLSTPGWKQRLRGLLRRWLGDSGEYQAALRRTVYATTLIEIRQGSKWCSTHDLWPATTSAPILAGVEVRGISPANEISDYWTLPEGCPRITFSTRSTSWLRGVLTEGEGPSEVEIVHRGLALEKVTFSSDGFAFQGAFHTDFIDLDLLGQKLIQNKRLQARIRQIRNLVTLANAHYVDGLMPEQLNSDLRERLLQELFELNRSSQDRPLLQALSDLPLIPLGSAEFASLAEVEQGAELHSTIHFVDSPEAPGRLHGRPLLLRQGQTVDRVQRLLKTGLCPADAYVVHARDYREPATVDYHHTFAIEGEGWQGTVSLPESYQSEEVRIFYQGVPLLVSSDPLFVRQTTPWLVRVDGEFPYSLAQSQARIYKALRAHIRTRLEGWIEELRVLATSEGAHLEHYVSLINLWWHGSNPERTPEELPPLWLDYPANESLALSDLLKAKPVEALPPPVQQLANWLYPKVEAGGIPPASTG